MNRKERRAAQKRGQSRPNAATGVQAAILGQAFALAQAGQWLSAEAACRNHLADHPNDLDAEHLLGQIALSTGRPDLAIERFRRAAAHSAAYASDFATTLHLLRRGEEAIEVLARATARWPADYRTAMGLAAILSEQGRHPEAVTAYRRVVALHPRSAVGHNGLGAALLAAGNPSEASRHFLEALKLAPEVLDAYANIIRTLNALRPALMDAVTRATQAWPKRLALGDLVGAEGLQGLAADELVLWLLESHTVCDLALERWVTGLRSALLATARDNPSGDEGTLRVACALARQGFLNDYLFVTSSEEDIAAARLREDVAAALAAGRPVVPLALAATAMYAPLGAIAGAEALATHDYPAPLAAVVRQQVIEPQAELAGRAAIARLTPIVQDTSLAVQRQYEESPYPRWVYPASPPAPQTVQAELGRMFPHAPLTGLPDDRDLDVLIAGCGTGCHAVEFAQKFRRTRVTAIDLSLTSLAYARRMSAELGLASIDYAQADVMELGALGRSYDVIDASGVLHHLADPFAGWRVLLGLLRPGGVMKLGLYSEIARRDIVAAREWIAKRGVAATPQDVRDCRHELVDANFAGVARLADFYSVSECRDLLFHVQEHRLALPAIAAFLAEQNATFLGFMLPPATIEAYRRQFPDDPPRIRLDHWHQFETENPDTFIGMYQFWIEKAR